MIRLAPLLALLTLAPALRAQEASGVVQGVALVFVDEGDDDSRSCLWPLEGTSGLCYLEALSADPVATCLWTAGMVGVSIAFLYVSDTVCGMSALPEAPHRLGRATAVPDAARADVVVLASPVMGRGVGVDGEAMYRVEAREAASGAPVPLDALGSLHTTIRETDLPGFLDALRTP